MTNAFTRKRIFLPVTLITVLFVLASLTGTCFAQSQFGSIKGNISEDISENPLVGTNVMLIGTRLGATTDVYGNFTIVRVPPGTYTLEVSFIGYKSETREVSVRANSELTADFTLAVDVLGLDEVVVTGMGGTQIKEKLGVSIASVTSSEITSAEEVNVVQALAGKAANIEVNQTSGDPGSSSFIRIRGGGSIDRGTQPLFVIDGVPIDNSRTDGDLASSSGSESANRASDINADDIASIEILKGAAASAIYGSRASNGVILITTKSGRPGKTRISYKFATGKTEINKKYPLQTWYGQGGSNSGSASTTSSQSWGPRLNTPGAPWFDASQEIDEVFDHASDVSDGGYSFDNSVTVSGGNELATFYLSAGDYYEKGHWVAGSDYKRRNFRLKGSLVANDKLKLTGNIMYTHTFQNMIQRGDNAAGIGIGTLRSPPNWNNLPWKHPDSGYHRAYTRQPETIERIVPTFDNPFWVMYEHINNQEVDRYQGYIRAEYDYTDWIQLSYTLGSDVQNTQTLNVMPPGSKRGDGGGRIHRGTFAITEVDQNLIVTVQGDKFLSDYDWIDATLMMGHNINRRDYHRLWAEGMDFGVSSGFDQLDNTNFANLVPNENQWARNIESYFSQVTIDLYEQLYLTGAFRNDGSSTFGAQKRYTYPKMSAAWDFTKNEDVPAIPYLDFGKVRFAYGIAGVQPSVYAILSNFTTGTEGFGQYTDVSLTPSYAGNHGFRSSTTKANVALKPERTREFEYGIDLAFWNSRIGVELTYYDQLTTDVIFDLNVAPSSGYFSMNKNAATISNKGIELAIDFSPVRTKNFQWDSRFIWATNDNMVEDMSGATWEGLGGNSYAYAGHPLGEYRAVSWLRFGHDMTWNLDGDASTGVNGRENIDEVFAGQWNKNDVYVGADGRPIEYDQEVWTGLSPNPDWTGSFRNDFTIFGDWTVSTFIDIVNDRIMNNYGRAQLMSYGTHADTRFREEEMPLNHWFTRGEKAIGPGATDGVGIPVVWARSLTRSTIGYGGDRWRYMEDAGYIKLREIALTYNLKHSFLTDKGISDVSFRLSGRNLKTWTDYKGWDPDTNRSQNSSSRGIDYFNSPQIRSFNFTLRVNF